MDVLSAEPTAEKTTDFWPDQDISPELRTQFFTELDVFEERQMWLEYVFLFNQLELLFPGMGGRNKRSISTEEIAAAIERAADNVSVTLYELKATGRGLSSLQELPEIVVELRAYGLDVTTLLSSDRVTNFINTIKGSSYVSMKHLLIAIRLGVKSLDADLLDVAWKEAEDNFLSNRAEFLLQYLATARILFPDKKVPSASPKKIGGALNHARSETGRSGVPSGVSEFVHILVATADEVTLGERGELNIKKTRKGRGGWSPQLPVRPVM